MVLSNPQSSLVSYYGDHPNYGDKYLPYSAKQHSMDSRGLRRGA